MDTPDYAGEAPGYAGETPDYAGFWNRFAAGFIDAIIALVGGLVITGPLTAFALLSGLDRPVGAQPDAMLNAVQLVNNLVSLVGGWLYFALMESSRLQGTLGKMAVQIKVTDLEGNRISFGRASGRHFGKMVSALALFIGYIMVAFTEKKQGLHDIMADCLVVRK